MVLAVVRFGMTQYFRIYLQNLCVLVIKLRVLDLISLNQVVCLNLFFSRPLRVVSYRIESSPPAEVGFGILGKSLCFEFEFKLGRAGTDELQLVCSLGSGYGNLRLRSSVKLTSLQST